MQDEEVKESAFTREPIVTLEEMKIEQRKISTEPPCEMDNLYPAAEEQWRACPSWPGYQASNVGRVMSPLGCLQKMRMNNLGYLKVAGVRRGAEKKAQSAHRMVADAWLGKCPKGKEVDHKDHDKANNRPENLQYITHRQNIIRAREAGRFPDTTGRNSPLYGVSPSEETRLKMSMAKRGENHWRTKRPDVEKIRELRELRLSDSAIAAQLGMRRTVVGDVLRGTHWSVRKVYVSRNSPQRNAHTEVGSEIL